MEEREQIRDGFASEGECQRYCFRHSTGLGLVQAMVDLHVRSTLMVDPACTNPLAYDG